MLLEPENCARMILVRHPQLAESHRSLAIGAGEAELSRRGMQHTLTLMRNLTGVNIDRFFAPPVAHCSEVAEALTKDRGIELSLESRMLDQNLGEWEGRSWEDLRRSDEALVKEFFSDYGLVAPPGGETLKQAVDRMLGWWNELAGEMMNKTLLIVAPQPILAGFSARLLGLSIRRALALNLPAGAYGILDVYRDGALLRCWHPLCLDDEVP